MGLFESEIKHIYILSPKRYENTTFQLKSNKSIANKTSISDYLDNK